MNKLILALLYIFILASPLYAPDFLVNENCPMSDNRDGIVVGYHFDEESGTSVRDFSGNGNTGTLNVGDNWTSGKFGNAYTFDGGADDYMTGIDDASIVGLTTFSILLWFKATDAIYSLPIWFGQGNAIGSNTEISLTVDTSVGIEYVRWRTRVNNVILFDLNTATNQDVVVSNTMYFIAVTTDGTTVKIYVNAIEKASGGAGGEAMGDYTGLDSNLIGGYNRGSNIGYLTAMLDDFEIFDRGLSAEEIYHIYHEQVSLH